MSVPLADRYAGSCDIIHSNNIRPASFNLSDDSSQSLLQRVGARGRRAADKSASITAPLPPPALRPPPHLRSHPHASQQPNGNTLRWHSPGPSICSDRDITIASPRSSANARRPPCFLICRDPIADGPEALALRKRFIGHARPERAHSDNLCTAHSGKMGFGAHSCLSVDAV